MISASLQRSASETMINAEYGLQGRVFGAGGIFCVAAAPVVTPHLPLDLRL